MTGTSEAQFWIGVHAAIVENDRILVLRRAPQMIYRPGHWDLPGGHLAINEEIHECLLREIDEETGLGVEIGPLLGLNKATDGPYVQMIFCCRPRHPRQPIRLRSGEHDASQWLTPAEIRASADLIPYLQTIARRGLLDRLEF